MGQYFDERAFYRIQSGGLVDNPDQRINDDITAFTATGAGAAKQSKKNRISERGLRRACWCGNVINILGGSQVAIAALCMKWVDVHLRLYHVVHNADL